VQGPTGIDRAQGGLGLGLALVKELTALHGGSVSAHSAGAGLGAAFTLRFPLVAAPFVVTA
jgi:signal transduction histidine kinase